jgi:hypothetical protein
MQMRIMFQSMPVICSLAGFLLVYALVIVLVFRTDKFGRKRKWVALDFVWVPLGGITGICLLLLWWQQHSPP